MAETDTLFAPAWWPSSLRCTLQGAVAILTLCRPEKRNALNGEMIEAVRRFFLDPPSHVRAAVLRGEGGHFSAGLDLSDIRHQGATDTVFYCRQWHRAFAAIEGGDVPLVAVLHGAVIGGGLELAAAAHIRVAEAGAFYALPEGQRGIFVGGGGSVRIPRLIGVARMTDMMLTGRTYGASDGAAIGLSQYLCAPGEGLALGIDLANRIAGNTPDDQLRRHAGVAADRRSQPRDGPAHREPDGIGRRIGRGGPATSGGLPGETGRQGPPRGVAPRSHAGDIGGAPPRVASRTKLGGKPCQRTGTTGRTSLRWRSDAGDAGRRDRHRADRRELGEPVPGTGPGRHGI